eukprot:15447328-Alexandrium_andersonii.AAC.1
MRTPKRPIPGACCGASTWAPEVPYSRPKCYWLALRRRGRCTAKPVTARFEMFSPAKACHREAAHARKRGRRCEPIRARGERDSATRG